MTDILEILLDDAQYYILIENIKAGRDVNITVKQFLSQTDRHKRITATIALKRHQLTQIQPGNLPAKIRATQELERLLVGEKRLKLDVLAYVRQIFQIESNAGPIVQLRALSLAGDLDAADHFWQPTVLEIDEKKLQQAGHIEMKLSEVYKDLAINSQELQAKARLTALAYDQPDAFHHACEFFEKSLISATRAATAELKNLVFCLANYSTFLQEHKAYSKAVPHYRTIMDLTHANEPKGMLQKDPSYAGILANFGALLHDQRQHLESERHLKEAFSIYSASAAPGWTVAQIHVMDLLGENLREQQRFEEAEDQYKMAFLRLEMPGIRAGDHYEALSAQLYNNLGILKKDQNDLPQAVIAYKKSLSYARNLAHRQPEIFEQNLVVCLINNGILHFALTEYDEAEELYAEAEARCRNRVKQNREMHFASLALVLTNRADNQTALRKVSVAEQSYQEAIAIYEQLYQEEPATYLPLLAAALNNIGRLYTQTKKFNDAEATLKKALVHYEQLYATTNKSSDNGDVAMALNNIGELFRIKEVDRVSHTPGAQIPQLTQAEGNYLRALKIYEALAQEAPRIYQPDVAKVNNNLGTIYGMTGRLHQTQLHLLKAFQIYNSFSEPIQKKQYRLSFAMVSTNLSTLYLTLGADYKQMSLTYAAHAARTILSPPGTPQLEEYRVTILAVLRAWKIDPQSFLASVF